MDYVEALLGEPLAQTPPNSLRISAISSEKNPAVIHKTIALAPNAVLSSIEKPLAVDDERACDASAFPKGALKGPKGDKQRNWDVHLTVRK